MSTNPGKRFGKYDVIAELGRGGMADVYLAVSRGPAGFSKLVVLKQLKAGLLRDVDNLAMFLDEARLAARLNHQNIVQTNEVGSDGESYYIAMEYLEGQSLVGVLRRARDQGGIPLHLGLRIIADACIGLNYAHSLKDFDGTPFNIVHRDISPHNLFVTYDGLVKLVDFGIAMASGRSIETETGVLKGKVSYMAPEQAQGQRVDLRADVFSLGVILFEVIAGRRLWRTQDVDTLRSLFEGKVPIPPREETPTIDDELDRIVRRALAGNRDERYGSAQEMQRDIEQYLDDKKLSCTQRQVGEFMGSLFEKERTQIAGVIEQQLGALQRMKTDEFVQSSLPTLTPSGGVSLTPSGIAGSRRDTRGGELTGERQTERIVMGHAKTLPPPRRSGRTVIAVAVGTAALLTGLAIWAQTRTSAEPKMRGAATFDPGGVDTPSNGPDAAGSGLATSTGLHPGTTTTVTTGRTDPTPPPSTSPSLAVAPPATTTTTRRNTWVPPPPKTTPTVTAATPTVTVVATVTATQKPPDPLGDRK